MPRLRAPLIAGALILLSTLALASEAVRIPMPPAKPVAKEPRMPGEPAEPLPGTYGYDKRTGLFRHPAATPPDDLPHPFAESLTYLDQNQYLKNTSVEAYYPFVVSTGHSWQATFDMNGHRYMYHYYRSGYKVYDTTNVRDVKIIAEKKFDFTQGDHPFGPFVARYNKRLGKMLAIQCYETPRFGVLDNKYTQPDKVTLIRDLPILRGFRIFELTSPTEWSVLSETTLDPYHSASHRPQQGSGCLDVPVYFGDKYLFVAGAPDDSFALQEYRSYLYSAAQIAYDVSNPMHPVHLSTWWVPGQRLGEEAEYRKNPRFGNKTSWMGARMPLFIPRSVEDGGKYGYAAMGGLGFFIVDISNPAEMKTVGRLDMPPAYAGTEGDNIDITKVEATGIVYYSGYPLNEDCYEPYKEIYAIDVKDPANPKILTTLPRPRPPKQASFTDYCQRRGSFGPKRTGYFIQQPGVPSPRYLPYAFYSAGMQMFDVRDPARPVIAAYFVPKMVDAKINLAYGNPVHGVYIEWDRHLIWVMSNHGIYVISSPLLGKPVLDLPRTP
jgi:hypothetical protein